MQGHYLVAIRLLGGDFVGGEMIWWRDAHKPFEPPRRREKGTLSWVRLSLSRA